MVVLDHRAKTAYAKYAKRSWKAVDTLVIHRTADKSPADLYELFKDKSLGTGGAFPYHFLVTADGDIIQAVALTLIAPGAGAWNKQGIQIALPGDFRKTPPPVEQYQALLDLCAALIPYAPHVSRHSPSKPGASKDEKKECPGAALDIDVLGVKAKLRINRQIPRAPGEYGIVL